MLSRRTQNAIHARRICYSPRSYHIPIPRLRPPPCVPGFNRLTHKNYFRRSSTQTTFKAGLSSYSILSAVGLALVTSLAAYRWTIPDPITKEPIEENSLQKSDIIIQDSPYHIAIGNMPPPPGPGRPGNLTSEQEAKLREFWVALLNVFGIHGEHAEGVNPVAHDEHIAGVERQDTMTSPDKKKKKHLGLFGKSSRKEKDSSGVVSTVDDTTAATTTTTTTTTTNDANDKYGQTKQFKAALASMTPEELRTTFWSMVKHDNPDALLLRFLRARKWDVEKALVMLVSTVHWRAHEAHVDDDVIRVGELGAVEAAKSSENPTSKKEAEDFLAQLRMGKSYLHGVDKDGRPMCIVRVKLHKQGEQSEASLERYTVFVIETARFLLQGGVDTAAVVFDMTDFSMANMDYAPVKFMIKVFEANYPESLGVILVHKAPWIFQGIWAIIKGWLDPVVASKIHFTKTLDDLQTFIPPKNITRELGGNDEWKYSYLEPSPTENTRLGDEETRTKFLGERDELVRRFEEVTLKWLHGSSLIKDVESGGSSGAGGGGSGMNEDIQELIKQRSLIAEELRKGYWILDPYVRARSIYDRLGIIKEGGGLEFYPGRSTSLGVNEKKGDGDVQ